MKTKRHALARRRGWPLLPVAPIIVAVIGIATAFTIAAVAAAQLQHTSDEAAALRSKALAATLAARLRGIPIEQRPTLFRHAARHSDATFLLVDPLGKVLVRHTTTRLAQTHVQSLLARAEGLTETHRGRVRFAASSVNPPMQHLTVIALVRAPAPADGTVPMGNAIAVLTLLLLGVAVAVALVFTHTARADVSYVRQRIVEMARAGVSSAGNRRARSVPLRAIDQVGLLTAALNGLIERFATAEQAYRDDLQAAAQLDNERSQFLAGLSHELRTPLNAILGFTHLLESEDEGPLSEEAREALEMIRTSGEHLKALIDDILDLSAMETGQLRLSRIAVDIYCLAEEVMREAKATLQGRQLLLSVVGMRNVFAWADARRLRQVLTNLVSNAVKATATGQVRITIAKRGDLATIAVEDSGRGIDPAALRAIFEPYKQAGDPVTRRGGAGLGLAIARRLVLLHGGTIEARSEVGRGSVFSISLPDETYVATLPRNSVVTWIDSPVVDARGRPAQ